ncbi:MAG: sugar ABC transporter permease [Cellulomonadaceae bacterium]|nr:sugar ABC transporter permease [Cellulomonadaceae bacterium]
MLTSQGRATAPVVARPAPQEVRPVTTARVHTPPGPARWARFKRRGAPYGFVSPTVVLLFVLMLIPIVMVVSYSVMDNVIVNKNPSFVGFANYAEVLGDPVFYEAIGNTTFFTGVSVVAHLVLGLGFAMLLNTPLLTRRTKSLFRVVYILPWLFTVAIIAVLWRLLLNPNGIVNYLLIEMGFVQEGVEWLASRETALQAVTFINVWAGYPFFMISLLAGLQGIPRDLYEAATVDGASAFQQFRNVTLPQLRPLIVAMAMLDVLWTTQQFALIWMTTGGGPIHVTEMLSTYTYKLAFSRYEFSMASTSATIILLLSMVLAFFYVRLQKARD